MNDRPTDVTNPSRGHRRWAGWALSAVVVWLVIWTVAVSGEGEAQPLLLGAVVLAWAAIAWLVAETTSVAEGIDWTPAYVPTSSQAAHDPRFSRLARMLTDASDRVAVGAAVQRTLRLLADDRLARSHGLDRTAQPDQARALLGDELFDYLRSPSTRRRGNDAAHLSRLLARIEAL